MSGREHSKLEKHSCAGDHKKKEVQDFHTCSIDRRGALTGVVTTRMHAAAKEKLSNLQEHMAGEVGVPCAGK